MSEEKKETLQDELENLAETFQSEYDKAAAEAENGPVIQELDDIVEEEEEEEETEEQDTRKKSSDKENKEKKAKKSPAAILNAIASPVLLILLILATAALTFYASAFTDLDSYIYSLKCAESAESASSKMNFYDEALGYLEAEVADKEKVPSFYQKQIRKVHELITVSTVDTEGYAAAMTYMHNSLTAEEIDAPVTAEFKAFLKIAGVFETLADNCVEKVSAGDVDFAALAAQYTDNATLQKDIQAVLEAVADAVAAEKENDIAAAADAYSTAIEALAEYSTSSRILNEKYTVCLAQTDGYAAALEFAGKNITAEASAEPLTEEFKSFAGVSDIVAGLADSVYDTVKTLIGDAATAPEQFDSQVSALNAPAYAEKELTALFANVASGFAKINAGSYAAAVEFFTEADTAFTAYGHPSAAVKECIAVATAFANGYGEALTYMKENLADAQPVTQEYKDLVAAASVFVDLDEKQFAAVSTAVAGIKDAQNSAIDLTSVTDALSLPDCLQAEAQALLTNLARGIISENKGNKKDAVTYYTTAVEAFAAIDVNAAFTLEKIAVLTNATEGLHAASAFIRENAKLLAATAEEAKTKEFASLLTSINSAFSTDKITVFIDNAKAAIIAADYGKVNVADIITKSNIDASVADFYTAYFTPFETALKAEKDKNLTLAVAKYQELADLLKNDGISVPLSVLESIIPAAFNSGDLATAVSFCTEYVTDDLLSGATAEFAELCNTVSLCDKAMQAAYEVFYQAYYAGYYGSVPTRDDLNAQFDALLTEDSNVYEKAFTDYYRYVCEMYFFASEEGSKERQDAYLDNVAKLIPDMVFFYGVDLISRKASEGDMAAVRSLAEKMLAINAYDDIALASLAKVARADGDLAKAASLTEKGLSVEDQSFECERQYIILCMLKGEFEKAYDCAVAIHTNGFQSVMECETVAVYASLFKNANATQKAKLAEILSYIENDLYGSYGYEYSQNTVALINGTKTLNDVFCNAPYDLW